MPDYVRCADERHVLPPLSLLRHPSSVLRPPSSEKGAAGLGGGRPPRTRSGDGEGWGRDRARVTPWLLSSARGGREARRPHVAERNPHVRIGLRLPLDEAVAGVRPQHDRLVLIVEEQLA